MAISGEAAAWNTCVMVVSPALGRRARRLTGEASHRDGDHMFLSDLSCRRSAESKTTVLSPLFFHQCEVVWISRATSPALCKIGTAHVLAYSTISPSMM